MSCQQVPTAPAFNPYPRSVQVGEFEVAIGGGIWVAIGAWIVTSVEKPKIKARTFRFFPVDRQGFRQVGFR